MESLTTIIDLFLNLDAHLAQWSTGWGVWTYVVLFLIIFAETGLVVTPFLPGDSLLFATGALTAVQGSSIELVPICILLIIAAILGDALNYSIGRYFGLKLFTDDKSKLFKKEHLIKTQIFYEKHGAKTIVLARFLPIIRTFAPFVAGMGQMKYRQFTIFNVIGATIWVLIFTIAGHFFGQLPMIQRNFHFVIIAIIVISFLPIFYEWWRTRSPQVKTHG